MRILVLLVATGAGTGYSRIAPGTVGSALGVAVFAGVAAMIETGSLVPSHGLGLLILALLGGALASTGVWASGQAEQLLGRKDDGRITIDEVSGVWIALLALPARLDVYVLGFLLFRLFDIWKPAPARRCEGLGSGLGVMADDWVAGIYANLAGQLAWRILWPGGMT